MNNLKYDTHVHTSEVSSCGKVDANTLVQLYKKAGYSGIVITDHYTKDYFESLPYTNWQQKVDQFLSGYTTAFEEGKEVGLKVILGMELRFSENFNDYLVFGFDKEFLYENPALYDMNIKTFREFIENTQMLIYQAHPFRVTVTPANPEYLHGVEIHNGNPRHNSNNQKALDFAKKYNLKMLSGSDFHQVQDIARGGIIINEPITNSLELAKMLRQDNVQDYITV
jgi:predicted metal-dependent phosphoesterase TrpH